MEKQFGKQQSIKCRLHIRGMFWLGFVSQCFNSDGVYIHVDAGNVIYA